MKLSSSIGLKGRFKFVMRKASTNEITKELPWTDNIVLDSGLARMSDQGQQWGNMCLVGSGNATPLPTDTGLTNFVASSLSVVDAYNGANATVEPYYVSFTMVYRFPEGSATGTLREVALGWANNSAWNKALIADENGTPTDLVKLADEYLDVHCQVRMYVESSYSGSVQLLDKNDNVLSTHTVTGLPVLIAGFSSSPHAFGSLTYTTQNRSTRLFDGIIGSSLVSKPNGSAHLYSASNGSGIAITYPTVTSMLTTMVYGLNSGNGNISSIYIGRYDNIGYMNGSAGDCCGFKFQIDPPIVKDDTQKLRIQHLLTWGRFTG